MTVIPLPWHWPVLSPSFTANRFLHATAVTEGMGEQGAAKRAAPPPNNKHKPETAAYKPKVKALSSLQIVVLQFHQELMQSPGSSSLKPHLPNGRKRSIIWANTFCTAM